MSTQSNADLQSAALVTLSLAIQAASSLRTPYVMISVDEAKLILEHAKSVTPAPNISPHDSPPPLVVCPACASKLDRLHEVHDCIPPSAYDTRCELAIPVTMLTSHEVNERYYGKRIGRIGF